MSDLTYRRARPSDARAILNLINHYSGKGVMLPRSFAQVVEKIRDFNVALAGGPLGGVTPPAADLPGELDMLPGLASPPTSAPEADKGGKESLVGVVALHVVGEDLAEVRSLAVAEGLQGKGVGRRLMEICLRDAKDLKLQRVFTLTYQTEFFTKLGFSRVEKLTLPQKIWGDCVHCAKFSDCDEIAMIKAIHHE